MNVKRLGLGWVCSILSVLGMTTVGGAETLSPPAPAKTVPPPDEPAWSAALPPGRINLGLHFYDQQTESLGDLLVPVYSTKSGLVFVNPRGVWNDNDGQEFNLGLGYRQLFPNKEIIAGANVFYDLRNTELDNTFNQFGFGLEFLSRWVDARANVYLPEGGSKDANLYSVADSVQQESNNYWYEPTGQGHQITQYGYDITSTYDVRTLQHYRMTEKGMDGFDAEIGALLPIPVVMNYADVKAFAGYYDFNAQFGPDISGVKARLEIKPLPALYLDAGWYEDVELVGSHYSVGLRASVPFDLANLSRGKNPFAGALEGFKPGARKSDFSSRMTEMVIRDLHVRTDVSDPEEITGDRKVLQKTLTGQDRQDHNLVLASDVTFVDDDNRSGVEDGSWEHPYRVINTGVQNAIGTMVYVRDAAQQYYENVVLREGLTLWGSGAPIYGQGNRFLGGIYPVVNGRGMGPAITLANNVTVAGLEITQDAPAFSPPPTQGPDVGGRPRLNLAGIYGENVTGVNIQQNYIHGRALSAGIAIDNFSTPSFTANISRNRIDDVGGAGISLFLSAVPEVDVMLADNNVTRCSWNGLQIYAYGPGSGNFLARISGNYSQNGLNGVNLVENSYDTAAALFVDTRANNNMGSGINVGMSDNSLSAVLMASHDDLNRIDQLVATVLGELPILPIGPVSVSDLLGVRGLYVQGGAMQANNNAGPGIWIDQQTDGVNLAGIIGAQADNNDFNGIEIHQSGYNDDADVSVAAVVRSQASGNGGSGMLLTSSGYNLALHVLMDVKANNNVGSGIWSGTYSMDGVAAAVMLASDPLASLVEEITANPLLSGLVEPMDMSFIPRFGQNQANGNGGNGIYIDAEGYDAALGIVLDAQANENGWAAVPPGFIPSPRGDGIHLSLDSENGTAAGIVASSEALMEMAGILLESGGIPLDLSGVHTLGPVQANDNGGNGIYISAYGADAAGVVLGAEALRNGYGMVKNIPLVGNKVSGEGVYVSANAFDGDAIIGLGGIDANDNGGIGILANAWASSGFGDAMIGGVRLTANDNRDSGIVINGGSTSFDSTTLVLGGIEANRNVYGDGINAWLYGNGSVMAALTDVQANDNGGMGIRLATDSYDDDSHVWMSDTALQDMIDYAGPWEFFGIDLTPLVPTGDIETIGNGEI